MRHHRLAPFFFVAYPDAFELEGSEVPSPSPSLSLSPPLPLRCKNIPLSFTLFIFLQSPTHKFRIGQLVTESSLDSCVASVSFDCILFSCVIFLILY